MATLSAILVGDSSSDVSGTITMATNLGATAVHKRGILLVNGTQDLCIKFGGSTVVATATSFRIPAGSTFVYDMGDANTYIDLYNNGASTATYWISVASKF